MTRTADLERAARMAYRTLVAREVRSLPVEPLAILHACRDTRVYSAEAAADALDLPPEQIAGMFREADAVTCRISGEGSLHYIVIYRQDGNPARLRFTLAHELGHRLLKHTGSSPEEEREADCFASHLLCPDPVLRCVSADHADAAERIASLCYVSRTCARMTLRRPKLALAPELAAAVEALLSDWLPEKPRSKGE